MFGPQPGERISFKWGAYSPADLAGEVVEAHAGKLAVRWISPKAGDLVVHLPRSADVVLD